MKIEIKRPIVPPNSGWKTAIANVLTDPLGRFALLGVFLNIVTECYYLQKIPSKPGEPITMVGLSFWISMILLFKIVSNRRKFLRAYEEKLIAYLSDGSVTAAGRFYELSIDDEKIEYGVSGLWRDTRYWKWLSKSRESDGNFELWFAAKYIVISIKDFTSASDLENFRNFLKTRQGNAVRIPPVLSK